MKNAAVMGWSDDGWELVYPVTICRVAPPTRDTAAPWDPDAFETEYEIYRRGYRWCECFTSMCRDGEFGHIQEPRLLWLGRAEFDAALDAIRRGQDGLLEQWMTYRLEAVRHELPLVDAFSGQVRGRGPGAVAGPGR